MKTCCTYTCNLSPCTRRTCVIHGRPSACKIDAATTSETASEKPSRPQDLEGPVSIISDSIKSNLSLHNGKERFVLPDYEYIFGFGDKHNHRIIGDYIFGLCEKDRFFASRETPLARKKYKDLPRLISRHGVQYRPADQEGISLSRQVIVTGAKSELKACDITARVRGGMVLRMSTATSPEPVGHTIIIEFARHEDAADYAVYAKTHSALLWGGSADVSLTKTPSYPLSYETLDDMMAGFTRLLVFLDFTIYDSATFLNHFKQIYRDPEEVLEDMWIDIDGVLFLLFKQVSHASLFFKIIMWREEILNWGAYKSARNMWRFAPDPCDEPLPPSSAGPRTPQRARDPYFSFLEDWIEGKKKGVPTTAPSPDYNNPHRPVSPLRQPTDSEVFEALGKLDGKSCDVRDTKVDMEHVNTDNIVEKPTNDSSCPRPSSPDATHYPRVPHSTPTMERPSVQPFLLGEDFSAILNEPSMSATSPTHSNPAECSAPEAQTVAEKPDYKGKGKEKQDSSTQDISEAPKDVVDVAGDEAGGSSSATNTSTAPESANATILDTPNPPLPTEEFETLIPKYMLPQNDPAYYELLNREPTDLVSLAEANAIFAKQPFRTIPMAEMRARYSAYFRVRDEMEAWERGEEYDPETFVRREPGRNFL
ncbi:hypothetical protein F4776DRAFT_673469 [Hypoxylon sp. NC0597]|nr:hypothetical protein F4776DRAFT_673469 [Hypoxylon sp. NC0597]